MSDLSEMGNRLQRITTEMNFCMRKREEEAKALQQLLGKLTDETVELLRPIVPEIELIRNFTVEQISANEHNEIKQIQSTLSKLKEHVDARLKYLEDHL